MFNMKFKKLVIFIVVFVIILNPVAISAEQMDTKKEPVSLTLEEVLDSALLSTISISQINTQIANTLKSSGFNYNKGEFYIADITNNIDTLYTKLKNGQALSSQQVAKLYILYAMFGDTAYFSGKDDIINYITPKIYPQANLWANVTKLSINAQLAEESIKAQVRVLYDSVLKIEDQLAVLNLTVTQYDINHKAAQKQYESGKISKISYESILRQLQTKKLELSKLNRSLDNLKIDLKRLSGIKADQDVKLIEYLVDNKKELKTYESYLKGALVNRNEIITAKVDYWTYLNDYSRAMDLYSNNPFNINNIMKKNMAEQKINEALLREKENSETVRQDITRLYIDANSQKEDISINKESLNIAKREFDNAVIQLNKKQISASEKISMEIKYQLALAKYKESIRTYDYSLIKLDKASQLGIGY